MMSDDEFYDAQTSPSDSDYSIDSIDLDLRDQRLKQLEKIQKREQEMEKFNQHIQFKLQDININHENLVKFRQSIDNAESNRLSNISPDDESEIDIKSAQPKTLGNLNNPKLEEEFINPMDKQILYQIYSNHGYGSDSDLANSEDDLIKDELSLNESEINQVLNESDQMESKSLSDHVINRKSFDTTSVNFNDHLKPSAKSSSKTKRIRKVISKFVRTKKHDANSSESEDSENDLVLNTNESSKMVKYKSSSHHTNEFERTQIIQVLSHESSENARSIIWSIKFSPCGKLLATAGKDKTLRIWILRSCLEQFIESIKNNNNNEVSPKVNALLEINCQEPFVPKALMTYDGHNEDILDISWSKVTSFFILVGLVFLFTLVWLFLNI